MAVISTSRQDLKNSRQNSRTSRQDPKAPGKLENFPAEVKMSRQKSKSSRWRMLEVALRGAIALFQSRWCERLSAILNTILDTRHVECFKLGPDDHCELSGPLHSTRF